MLRRILLPLTAFALMLALPLGVTAYSAPSQNLALGDQNADVLLLQQLLNTSPDTAVAAEGPGSPGHETDYFGQLTLSAVKRFQQKYQNEILTPLGLSSPTGYVGSATLTKLRALADVDSSSISAASATFVPTQNFLSATSSPTTSSASFATSSLVVWTPDLEVPQGINPNSINLDYFITEVDGVASKQGYSADKIAQLNTAIRDEAASTTDFRKAFYKSWNKSAMAKTTTFSEAVGNVVLKALSYIGLAPKTEAATPASLPFGGKLLYALPCTCSGNWEIGVEPLPPTYVSILSYYTGTQAYAYHNIPATTELLGLYTPGVGICLELSLDCAPIPTEGLITPIVGSSL